MLTQGTSSLIKSTTTYINRKILKEARLSTAQLTKTSPKHSYLQLIFNGPNKLIMQRKMGQNTASTHKEPKSMKSPNSTTQLMA